MKKFNFKALLIAALAIIMAVALVACDPKEKDPDPGPSNNDITSQAYFDNLFTLINEKGADKVEGENLKINFDVQLGIGAASVSGHTPARNGAYAKLGLDVTVVLDRKTPDAAKNTGAKVRLYTPTSNGETDICTVYATLDAVNDADKNLYVEAGGQKVKIPVGGIKIDNKGYDDLASLLFQKLADETLDKLNGVPVKDIITAVTEDMGTDWDINAFVTGILNLVGRIDETFDLRSKLENLEVAGMKLGGLLPGLLLGNNKTYDDMFKEGTLQVDKILHGNFFNAMFYKPIVSTTNNVKTYRTIMNDGLWDILDNILPESVKSPYVELTYKEKDQEIDEFKLYVQTNAKNTKFKVGNIDCTPFLELIVKDFDIEANTNTNTAQAIGLDASEYGYGVGFNGEVQIDLKGFKVDPSKFHSDDVYDSVGAIDLAGKITVGANVYFETDHLINTIRANVYAKIGDRQLLGVSYANNKITVVADSSVMLGGQKAITTVMKLFGEDIYSALADGVFKDHMNTLNAIEAAIFNRKTEGEGYDHTSFNENFKGVRVDFNLSQEFDKFKEKFNTAFNGVKEYLKKWNDDNGLQQSNFFKRFVKFTKTYKNWFDLIKNAVTEILKGNTPNPPEMPQANAVAAASKDFAKQHWKEYVEAAFGILAKTLPVCATKDGELTIDVKNVLDTISQMYNMVPQENEGSDWDVEFCKQEIAKWLTEKFAKLKDKRIPEKLATGITIAGVTPFDKDADGADPIQYLVDALFDTLNVKLTFNCNGGYSLSVAADVNASASAQLQIGFKAIEKEDVVDYASQYVEGEGWTEFH